MLLFINACVRDNSRTKRIASSLIEKLEDRDVEEVKLYEVRFPVADKEFLKRRDSLLNAGKYDDESFELARQFAGADEIVIAAPYWDLSFPAALKQYVEQINAVGITFAYTDEGVPYGKVKAKTLWYVTSAGGNTYVPHEFGYGYIKALCEGYYGIRDVRLIKAEGLDLPGADEDAIVQETIDLCCSMHSL